jgi:hypothetical protein
METFINYTFHDNISKKRIKKELSKIEIKYKLDDNISKYYSNQWFKYLQNKSNNYANIPINKCTNNAVEIFNTYFHKKCNGKGLITIYEMCNSIKTEFKEKEDLLLISEKNIVKKITKNKK